MSSQRCHKVTWPFKISSLRILPPLSMFISIFSATLQQQLDCWDVFVAQISELSDLVDRPLVAALTSRLQALHAHLQAFVEQVDGLVKPPAGGKDAEEEGESPPASNGSPLPCSGDSQDGANSAGEKVKTKDILLFTPFTHFSLFFISCYFCWNFLYIAFSNRDWEFYHVSAERHP